MKGRILSILFLAVLLLATGCAGNINRHSRIVEDLRRPVVYASIYPMYDFAKNIGGNRIDLRMVVSAGADPHDWEPTAKLMVELDKADVFIYNGVGMEPWADNLIASLTGSGPLVVEASKGIDLLKHGSADESHHNHSHTSFGYDPHVWLDPERAVKQAENIMHALIEVDCDNEVYYRANFQGFLEKLQELDTLYSKTLSRLDKREIVVTHAAFGYLADRYGLEQISVTGLNPREEPSAAQLVALTDLLRKRDIGYIFFETLTSPKLAAVLADEVGAKTKVLNPIGGLTKQQMDEGLDYLSAMRQNLDTLKEVLGQ
ncbi:MAG: metal ABC transporter substrate-binding protein [Bacillota bacterium]|nr:metal ABC transporter substrate-binding protein [Bacillota bacterium]MDD3298360.1 metal ABC transporter substrate-binding protein [Bacillota bacterium]MDD3851210.1 metal ABC transporter substrate-binding protein [Bacillota bacterium]MDD4707545.1 metal ABC transporter substrate-binding protein [Bacillota bacterium]